MSDYYPLKRGQTRRYRSRAPGEGQAEYTVETVSVTSVPRGPASATMRNVVHTRPPQVSEYEVDKNDAGVFERGEKALPLPPRVGAAWDAGGRAYEIVADQEVVSTPAGLFIDCLKVQYLIAGGDAGGGTRYYAPGVGLVKEECADEADPFVAELVALR